MAEKAGISRRTFATWTAAGAVTAAASTGVVWVFSGDDDAPVAFAVDHGDDVYVWMDSGEQFTVRVHQRNGRVLETFSGVTAQTLGSLSSEHVSFRVVPVPAAA